MKCERTTRQAYMHAGFLRRAYLNTRGRIKAKLMSDAVSWLFVQLNGAPALARHVVTHSQLSAESTLLYCTVRLGENRRRPSRRTMTSFFRCGMSGKTLTVASDSGDGASSRSVCSSRSASIHPARLRRSPSARPPCAHAESFNTPSRRRHSKSMCEKYYMAAS